MANELIIEKELRKEAAQEFYAAVGIMMLQIYLVLSTTFL